MTQRQFRYLLAFTIALFASCSLRLQAQDTTVHVVITQIPEQDLKKALPQPQIIWGGDSIIPVHTIYVVGAARKLLDKYLVTSTVEIDFIATHINGYGEQDTRVDSIFEITEIRRCKVIKATSYRLDGIDCGDDHVMPQVHLHLHRQDCGPSRIDLQSQIEQARIDHRHRVDLVYCSVLSGGQAYWVDRNPLEPSRWRRQ